MPNGPLNQTIGYGPATVWNPNVAAQNFGVLLQKQKQQDEEDANAIAAELSKVRSDGLRNDADRQYFLNRYSEIRKNATSGLGERNTIKRALNKAQTHDDLLALQQYVQRSKAQGEAEHSFGQQYMSNPTPWSDEAAAAYRKSIVAPLDSSDVISDFTRLQRRPNEDKIHKDISGLVAGNLGSQQYQDSYKKGARGNIPGTWTSSSRTIDPEKLYLGAGMYYDSNRDFQHLLQQKYPEIYANNAPLDAKSIALKHYVDSGLQGGLFGKTVDAKEDKFNPDKAPDLFYEHRAYAQAHPTTGGAVPGVSQNINIPYNGGERGANVQSLGYVPVNTASLNLAGSPSYNLSTGAAEPQVLSSGDHQLVGAGNFPFIKKGYKFAGSISQPNFAKEHPEAIEYRPMLHVQTKDVTGQTEDHLVPYDRLPANLPKATKVALTGFVPKENQNAENAMVTVTLNGQTGQIPHSKLKDFLKKYPSAKTQ